MLADQPRYTFDRVVRLIITVLLLAAGLFLLRYLSSVLIPFAAAVVLAYLLNPIVNAFEQKTNRRWLAVLLTLAGVSVFGLGVVVAVVPMTINQVSRFQDNFGQLQADFAASLDTELAAYANATGPPSPRSTATDDSGASAPGAPSDDQAEAPAKSRLGWRELMAGWQQYRTAPPEVSRGQRLQALREGVSGTYIGDVVDSAVAFVGSDEFTEWTVGLAKQVAAGGWTVISFFANLVLGMTVLILVLIYLVFLLLDYPSYAKSWRASLPPKYRESLLGVFDEFEAVLRRCLRGQALVALAMGLLFSIGFTIIGLPLAIPLGLFIGALNMVPYLQTIGLVPALLLALMRAIENQSSIMASVLLMLAVFGAAQVIQDSVITPRIMGKVTGLRPITVLLGVFIWGKLLGFLGLLLAIPLTCLAIAYYRRVVLHASREEAEPTPS